VMSWPDAVEGPRALRTEGHDLEYGFRAVIALD
jgi:hypothetical protein